MIADGEIADAIAQRLDDAGGLVAERHRGRARTRAVDDGKVGMAETGGFDPDENLAAAGRREIEFDDLERARGRIRGRKAGLGEDGGFDAHGALSRQRGTGRDASNDDAGLSCPVMIGQQGRQAEGFDKRLFVPAFVSTTLPPSTPLRALCDRPT